GYVHDRQKGSKRHDQDERQLVAMDGAGGDEAGAGKQHRQGTKGYTGLSCAAHGSDETRIALLRRPEAPAAGSYLRSTSLATAKSNQLPQSLDAVHQMGVHPAVLTANFGCDWIDPAPAQEQQACHQRQEGQENNG